MFDTLRSGGHWWLGSGSYGKGMPLSEKDREESVPYPYRIKKVTLGTGCRIAYIDEGDPQAEVLLFVHGMGSGIPVWEKTIREFTREFRCVALDLPGHGYSSKGDFPYTMKFYADVLLRFMAALQLPRVTLIGHSMGGQASIITALRNPAVVERLVLVAPAGVDPYTSSEKQFLINTTAGLVASGNAFTKNRLNYLLGFCSNQEEAGELAGKMAFFKDEAREFGRMMLRSVEGMLLEDVTGVLSEITQPCLIVVGEDDKVSPYEFLRGERYADVVSVEAAKIPRCRVVVFPRCGHFVQYQRAEAFNKELKGFLAEKSKKG